MEIDNSVHLLSRLKAGLLDAVISYGTEREVMIADPKLRVGFSKFSYPTRFVMICHPKAALWSHQNVVNEEDLEDFNEGYWSSSYFSNDKYKPKLHYEQLREVRIDDVSFKNTGLIIVRSHTMPRVVTNKAKEDPSVVRYVSTYDEALALVKMGCGHAVTSEVYSKSDHITAFRFKEPIESDEDQRWVGAYYSLDRGLDESACKVVEFVRDYVKAFEPSMRSGSPLTFEHPSFKTFIDDFRARLNTEKWDEYSEAAYPKL